MLEPRETDIPVLFLVFVVLPLVTYILLGKWSESTKKKERVNLLAQRAAEESLRVEVITAASVIPVLPLPNDSIHQCARCFGQSKTRCKRCKSVWYCSGKCQIIHWREVHKHECHQMDNNCSNSPPSEFHGGMLLDGRVDFQSFEHNINQPMLEETSSENTSFSPSLPLATTACNRVDTCGTLLMERRCVHKRPSLKSSRDSLNKGFEHLSDCSSKAITSGVSCSPLSCNVPVKKASMGHKGTKLHKSPKSMMKASRERTCSDLDQKETARKKDAVPSQRSNGVTGMGIIKMIGFMKPSKLERQETLEVNPNQHKKVKMLFPYEDFVKFFQCEALDMSPRGLINCGNSCYANAVLQCLSRTKPLTVFLLRKSHSRACCVRDWCLMCELEQHLLMLRESGGPLSPSRILSHMRSINCQIGDGSQEDAHEFLRLLVASMQSICLEGFGGENVVDPRLQETTFIQHTFGGRLRSKVKCLKCHHESEMSENIMDLTLEIFGWVESLEDALTQFTNPEDLDGENMYRCGRCATYVRARKQLNIQEAPNILTIVLKRFQEGSYGKINKCITFPDMLDMVPFMTGTDDIPPLYMLYAVVVHLDTLNASFSGHYISYVKDMQGNWFRIDDTQVQLVEMTRVMSEGAYILFYMRSSPRPSKACSRITTRQQAAGISKHWSSRAQKSSRAEQGRLSHSDADPELPSDHNWEMGFSSYTPGLRSPAETYAQPMSTEFSDATSSDWSIFTSSDDASFTTESTRDSFSTVDYADASNVDAFSSIFSNMYASGYPPQPPLACSTFSASKPRTRFFSEQRGSVVEHYQPHRSRTRVSRGSSSKRISVLPSEAIHDVTYGVHVGYGNDTGNGPSQIYVNCNM